MLFYLYLFEIKCLTNYWLMKRVNFYVFCSFVLCLLGCSTNDLTDVEGLSNEVTTRSTGNERIIALGDYQRVGTNYVTMQVSVNTILPEDITVYFTIRPLIHEVEYLNEIISFPSVIKAGTHSAEVEELPISSACDYHYDFDDNGNPILIVDGYTSKYLISIKRVEYTGDNNPLYIDSRKWTFTPKRNDTYTYGYTIDKTKYYEGKKNIRPPYDVIDPPSNPRGGTIKDPPRRIIFD